MDVYSIIGLLASQIRLIHQVKILKNRGLSNQEIASSLGVKSTYQIKKMAEYGVLYSNKDIYEFTHLLADIDLKIKTKKLYSRMKDILKEREQTIIELRFGLGGEKPKTQNQIAKMLRNI